MRAICNLEYNASTDPHFVNLKFLKLFEIYRKNLLVHFHDTVFSNMNTNLQSILRPHSSFHEYNTRGQSDLVMPLVKRTKTKQGFYCTGISEWNSLPSQIRNTASKPSFTRQIVDLFISQY